MKLIFSSWNVSKLRIGVGILAAYTSYAGYIQLKTKYEISERARKEQYDLDVEHLKSKPWPITQYGTLVVGGRYANPFPEYRPQTIYEFLYCRVIEMFHTKPRGGVPANAEEVRRLLPAHRPDFDLLFSTSNDYTHHVSSASTPTLTPTSSSQDPDDILLPSIRDRLTLTWLGQSCAFVQCAGVNVLTDPCFGEHLVHPYVGPKRISPPPCHFSELPKIDLVLVSHDHPDHFELETAEQIGNSATWIVPVGMSKHLKKLGIDNYKELSWWEKTDLPGTDPAEKWEIACTPAMHWSGRNMLDANTTLWCSFVVLRDGKPVFFHAGDTGYSQPLFDGIKHMYGGGCQVAMVPCGAYTPRWHLRSQHTNPQEAIQIMKDLGAQKLVGVHWGTFVLSEEHFLEPRELLHELAKKENRAKDIIAPDFGRTLVFRLHDTKDIADKQEHEMKSIREGKSLLFD
ncbi:uncharacterized protein SAPINGB_P001875 [Magnusiomyces paraingens]|uniref:Metallo-beta-lactamase domain-containing protein n=1 Tax=Magnusiomyces paraingens TaxID=2606893 RepID=A0A5E8BIV3_9ASCO|nr:uncharacterized protein SAPINGB_P001875 [Saprochaete ingens]VVT48634.1 unnamed protein product [Saprochaete ingens]